MRILRVFVNKLATCTFRNSRHCHASKLSNREGCAVLIVGAGSGGCAVAAKLARKLGKNKIVILDPSDKHYYQPMFTLIGGGMETLEKSYRLMNDVIPKDVKWFQDKAVYFDPKNNTVTTSKGSVITYDILLIAMGLQLNYEEIPGLVDSLSVPNGKVCSIYSPKYVNRTYQCLKTIQDGSAIFTFPASPVKCPGAPQKIMYIADHYFRKMKKRNNINVIYNTTLPVIFGVKHYADALWKITQQRDIEVNVRRNLVEVKPESDIAVFQNLDNPSDKCALKFSMLHVVPPMNTPTELAQCKELINEAKFVNVDQHTLQHVAYKNVFAIGDCCGTPNSKTAASAAAQSPVVFRNMMAQLSGKDLEDYYDGYASCPIVTGYRTCILAEFNYDLMPLETFPFPQNKERYSMFVLKRYLMPNLYWHLMLKGYWNGPELVRKTLSPLTLKANKTH